MTSSDASADDPESVGENVDEKRKAAEILPSMYEELKALAGRKMAMEAPGQTIGATALVHEAFLRIAKNQEDQRWDNRGHFYVAAAEAMRRILIDRARRKRRIRHGGEWKQTALDSISAPAAAPDRSEELLALDEALQELAKKDERKGRLVELRYFVGLSSAEAAEVLGISVATADRDWAFARAWLHSRLRSENK